MTEHRPIDADATLKIVPRYRRLDEIIPAGWLRDSVAANGFRLIGLVRGFFREH